MVVEKNKSVSRLGSGDNTIDCLFFAAMCCRVWQCAAMYCSVLQRVAVCCSVSQCVALCCSISFRVERQYDKLSLDCCLVSSFGSSVGWLCQHCYTMHHTQTHLQHTTPHCNTLQHTATHCNTLQHTATHCNTL